MASVYRKSTGVYYLAVSFQNKRITRSLGTCSLETAKKLTPLIEKQILSELINGKESRRGGHLSFPALVKRYLNYNNHDWANSTLERYKTLLGNYISNGMPDNPTTKSMTIRVINSCNNWGYKHGLIAKPVRMEGGSKWATRNRVYTESELKIIFEEVRMSSSIPLFDSPTPQGLGVAKYGLYREKMYWRVHWSSAARLVVDT